MCAACDGPWTGTTCVVPDMDKDALKRLSDKMLDDTLAKLAEESPKGFQCVYDAYSFAGSFNGGVEASKRASKVDGSTKDKLEGMFDQVKASHDSAGAILDALKDCSDTLPPSAMAALQHGLGVANKVSMITFPP